MAENERFMTGSLWIRSLREFKKLNVVAFCGMMCAVAMALNMVASITVGPYIRIGFSGLPNQVVAYLFGPAVGGIFGGALDVIKYILKPEGAFFPGFTISAILGGVIYGALLYKKKLQIGRVFAAQLLVKVFVNILLNTLWLNMLYGKAFLAILPGRLVSNAVMLPIDTAIMFFMLQAVDRTIRRYFDDNQ
ncbi:MAG: folate family ECF transporter S component [Acutalibacteraceae bacterium]|jgi:ECF transporter S component (folate family)|nr:folate family ECF transporter S component [Acutalibacteraceae bacterium]